SPPAPSPKGWARGSNKVAGQAFPLAQPLGEGAGGEGLPGGSSWLTALPSQPSGHTPLSLSRSLFLSALLVGLAVLFASGCRRRPSPGRADQPAPVLPLFTEVAAASGITFRHETGGKSPLNILQTA